MATKTILIKGGVLLNDHHSPNLLVMFVQKIKYPKLRNRFSFLSFGSSKYNHGQLQLDWAAVQVQRMYGKIKALLSCHQFNHTRNSFHFSLTEIKLVISWYAPLHPSSVKAINSSFVKALKVIFCSSSKNFANLLTQSLK